jgi:hypothetical protein
MTELSGRATAVVFDEGGGTNEGTHATTTGEPGGASVLAEPLWCESDTEEAEREAAGMAASVGAIVEDVPKSCVSPSGPLECAGNTDLVGGKLCEREGCGDSMQS